MSEGRYYFNALVGLVSVGSLSMLLKHQVQVFLLNRDRKKAFNTQEFTPSQLTEAIQCNSETIQKFFYQTNEDIQKRQIRGRAFISGLTHTNQPIFSDFQKRGMNIPLIYKIKYDEDVYSLDNIDPQKKTYNRMSFPENSVFQRLPMMYLYDPQNKNYYSEIKINNDTDVKQVLQYIGSIDKFGWKSISDRVLAFIISLLKAIMAIIIGKENPLSRSVRGIRLGIRETEIGIQIDSPVLAYGEIVYDIASNTCRMESPIALTNDKMQYLKQINQKLSDQRFMRNFFGVIFAGTALYFARRFWHFSKRLKLIQKQDEIINNLWEQAAQKSENKCEHKKENLNDEDIAQWMDDNEKGVIGTCKIAPNMYDDKGRQCKTCKQIYLQAKEQVLREEQIKEEIISNRHNKKK